MNIVNDEFILELEKDYEYGRSHIKELWNLLQEKFSFIENDELGAYTLERIIDCRSSKKLLIFEEKFYQMADLPLSLCKKYDYLNSDIEKIVREVYSQFYDKIEKDYLNDEREKDAYKFVYKKIMKKIIMYKKVKFCQKTLFF